MENNIFVVNKHQMHKSELLNGCEIYIGRGSAIGNPYTHLPLEKSKAVFQVENREQAVACYERWIWQKIGDNDEAVIKELENIKSKALKGNVYLVCYCKPKLCHGDIIKGIIEKSIKTSRGWNELGTIKIEDE